MRNNRAQNIIGPKLRALRVAASLTQADLARKCQLKGFDISRAGISQIESLFRKVSDLEMILLARVLGVAVTDLIPKKLPPWVGRAEKE